jgi:siroheme synthase
MIDYARRGMSVVRLKSGDPLVFGRAGEEMDALRTAGVPFEVVPGITAAFAAAAALRRPLTDRRSASSISFSSGHHAAGSKLQTASRSGATRVVYMPGRDLTAIAAQLRSIVSRAGQPEQRIVQTTLAQLERVPALPAPAILLAGEALRETEPSELDEIAGYAPDAGEPKPDSLEF